MWDPFKQFRPGLEQELTERQRFELELRVKQAELERRIAELSAENASLQAEFRSGNCSTVVGSHSATESIGAERQKDRFLDMLAHDLRNAISAVAGAIQVMSLRDAQDRETVSMREIIIRQTSHMSRMVNDLMELSRIGQIQLRQVRLDLVELVRNTAQDLQHTLDERTLSVKLELPATPVQVAGDPARLSQAIAILLQNSVKLINAGGTVSVTVGADAERGMAEVRFQETGGDKWQGIWPQALQDWRKGDGSRESEHNGGVDLGLFLARGMVDLHGGELLADGFRSGQQVALTIRIPLATTQTESSPNEPIENGGSQALRILIIDDQRDASYPLRKLLESDGHCVEVAVDGPTGIKAASQIQPQVVLCDIVLSGGMNGFEVAQALRTDPRNSTALLVAVTGDGREEDRRQSAAAGFDRHLTKPVGQNELRSLLSSFTHSKLSTDPCGHARS